MNKFKLSNPVRLIAFFLTAVVLTCTFGFTVDGWQIISEEEDKDVGPFPPLDDALTGANPSEPEIYIPQFVNRLTGLETTEDAARKSYFSFVMDSTLPSYGISIADLLCEIPTENGDRYLAFISDIESLSKIGSLTPTRDYISNVVRYFGGVSVAVGKDDSMDYIHCDNTGKDFDLTNDNYYYTEFTSRFYTNSDLLSVGLRVHGFNFSEDGDYALPFKFADFGSLPIVYDNSAASQIKIKKDNSTTELRYNENSLSYILYKNELPQIDSLNGKMLEFTNCFILFADSITYDKAEYSQMVMDTLGQGTGYYITQGSYTKINWVGSEDGTLLFYTPDGEQLVANRGRNYITFVKSSTSDSVYVE